MSFLPFFLQEEQKMARNLPPRSYWGWRAWISSPRFITRWKKNPSFLCLWSPARKTDFLAIDLDSWECWSSYSPPRLPSFTAPRPGMQATNCLCHLRWFGTRPRSSQKRWKFSYYSQAFLKVSESAEVTTKPLLTLPIALCTGRGGDEVPGQQPPKPFTWQPDALPEHL